VKDYLSSLSENGVPSLNEEGREVVVNNAILTPMHLTLHHYEEDEAKYVAVLHDITHLKQAAQVNELEMKALSEQLAQKNMFVAGISHEIRTPLNAIIGFSEAIIEERFGALQPSRYKAYVEDIKTAGTHILELVNDLLDLSKLEAGQHEFDVKPLDVNSVFEASVKLIEPQAFSAKVMVRKAYTRPLPQVLTDERALKQVLVNLLANAVKFTPSHGQIILSTMQNEFGEVVLRVRDTGKGMSEQELSRSMKPYMSSTNDKSGTGLGLPLVKALTDGLKAKLLITSQMGQGTLVEITFPQSRILV
jgi:signal transduction histidine kinase